MLSYATSSKVSFCCQTISPLLLMPLQAPSPDGTAVLENSEQFKVHLLAAIEDPRVKE